MTIEALRAAIVGAFRLWLVGVVLAAPCGATFTCPFDTCVPYCKPRPACDPREPPVVCDDGDPCTTDTCQLAGFCDHEAVEQSTFCRIDRLTAAITDLTPTDGRPQIKRHTVESLKPLRRLAEKTFALAAREDYGATFKRLNRRTTRLARALRHKVITAQHNGKLAPAVADCVSGFLYAEFIPSGNE